MDAQERREIMKFIETATDRQLDEKRLKLEMLRGSLNDSDVVRNLDWIQQKIWLEQQARIESGTTSVEHITLETPKDQK